MKLTFYWCVLQGETQESRKGTDQVDSDDVEIQKRQRKEQTGIHLMSECCQNSGERFLESFISSCFVLINEHFLFAFRALLVTITHGNPITEQFCPK